MLLHFHSVFLGFSGFSFGFPFVFGDFLVFIIFAVLYCIMHMRWMAWRFRLDGMHRYPECFRYILFSRSSSWEPPFVTSSLLPSKPCKLRKDHKMARRPTEHV